MDSHMRVVLLLILQLFSRTELLDLSAQPTVSPLPEDDSGIPSGSMMFINETDIPSSQENITPDNTTYATMNNTDISDTHSNETWTSIEDMSDDGTALDNTSLNITDTNDINTNNTNTNDTSEGEMGSGDDLGLTERGSGKTTSSPDTYITKSTNPKGITTIATTTTTMNSTTHSSLSPINEGLDDRRDSVYTGSNQAADSAQSNTRSTNSTVWAIVIGTALGVGAVGLTAFILLKRRGHRNFSHRKLVEDLPAGPVLRLDSYETLGVGNLSFNNAGLQGDDIHMGRMGGAQKRH